MDECSVIRGGVNGGFKQGCLSKMVLCFRVKFYPEDPMKLHEEITRYYLFLQLRRDLHHGRLLCPHDESIQLAAYIIQSEVGDYDPQDHPLGYVSEFKMLPKQTPKHEEKIMEAHKALAEVVPSECEADFLKKAANMDTYGVDPHQVKDQRGDQLYLGVTHLGIMTFRGSRRTQLFKWNQIRRIAYEGKMFVINHSSSEEEDVSSSKKKHQAVGYRCTTAPAAKYLWRCAVEQQLFFTLSSSATAPKIRSGGGLFTRGSRFRFSGRCQNEAYEASENIRRTEPPFARTSSLPNFGKKNHSADAKNNTLRDSLLTDSFRDEAAVDVPSLLGKDASGTDGTPGDKMVAEASPTVTAPLAQVEAYEEQQQQQQQMTQSAAPTVNAALPPKENGQAVIKENRPGVLETSIDESLTYEPNRTFEESDDEQEKPGLDEQIKKLEEEIINPEIQKQLNLSSAAVQSEAKPKAAASESKGSLAKTLFLSVLVALLLAAVLFYVVFFSPLQSNPLVSSAREHLKFLEPVRDAVQQKVDDVMKYLKK
ncbi:FERM domain-containing protein 3 [Elysia marginata]|uniref:FERM domain-containing protein 3 n=1 Tax=Elysia marginata TaxID=1093978 RepID=A0AAV4I7L0_9GAST|nr:FERM domain-containing protein 3 [Elysia marginata]